jgi:high-affinity nickel permease
MTLMDTTDGVLMSKAYDWALLTGLSLLGHMAERKGLIFKE